MEILRLHEALIAEEPSLEQAVESLPVSEQDDRLKVIYFDGDTEAVAGLRIGMEWKLIAERSEYEPTGETLASEESSEPVPFNTYGEWWMVDPATGIVIQEDIEFEEGMIQGLVYALDAVIHGGRLTSRDYVDWLVEKYQEVSNEACVSQEHVGTGRIVGPNDTLAFVLEKAGLIKVEAVLMRVGMGIRQA